MTALCRTCAKARVSEGRQCERCWVRSVPVLRADALDEDQAEREAAIASLPFRRRPKAPDVTAGVVGVPGANGKSAAHG